MIARPTPVASAGPGDTVLTGPSGVLAETGFGCLLSTRLRTHRAAV